MFCRQCGKEIPEASLFCAHCGAAQAPAATPAPAAPGYPGQPPVNRRWLTTLLLCFFLGAFGVHRFYIGKVGTGLLMLFTLGGCGIWVIIDFIMLATASFTDVNGERLNYIE